MKTENLTQACHSFEFFIRDLRGAHTDAVNSKDGFAEMALLDLIEDAAKLGTKVERIKAVAGV